jgi:hypothetical protein
MEFVNVVYEVDPNTGAYVCCTFDSCERTDVKGQRFQWMPMTRLGIRNESDTAKAVDRCEETWGTAAASNATSQGYFIRKRATV